MAAYNIGPDNRPELMEEVELIITNIFIMTDIEGAAVSQP